MITPESVRALAPELAAVPDERIQFFINQAERRVNRDAWGARADDGVTYLTAHLVTQAGKGAGADPGPVSSVSVGEVSQSYAVPSDLQGSLGATHYGREFLEMRGLVFACRVV